MTYSMKRITSNNVLRKNTISLVYKIGDLMIKNPKYRIIYEFADPFQDSIYISVTGEVGFCNRVKHLFITERQYDNTIREIMDVEKRNFFNLTLKLNIERFDEFKKEYKLKQ